MHQSEHRLSWDSNPFRRDPVRAVLVVLILVVCSSLTVWWLGYGWPTLTLITLFVFSLRDFLLPSNMVVDGMGITLSAPLTGAKCWSWDEISGVEAGPRGLHLLLNNGTRRRIPQAPDLAALDELRLRVKEYLQGENAPE